MGENHSSQDSHRHVVSVVTLNWWLSIARNLCKELGHVDVHDGLEQQDRLVLFGVLEFEVPGSRQHWLDGSHAIVVMMLWRQLLWTQLVRRHDLLRQTATGVSQYRTMPQTTITGHLFESEHFKRFSQIVSRIVNRNRLSPLPVLVSSLTQTGQKTLCTIFVPCFRLLPYNKPRHENTNGYHKSKRTVDFSGYICRIGRRRVNTRATCVANYHWANCWHTQRLLLVSVWPNGSAVTAFCGAVFCLSGQWLYRSKKKLLTSHKSRLICIQANQCH